MSPRIVIVVVVSLLFLVALPETSQASEVMKIAENRFMLSDQAATSFSGTGAMQRKVYRLAASLCEGLDYSWFLPLDSEASGGGLWANSNAGASLEVEYYGSEDEALARAREVGTTRPPVECEPLADEKAKNKLLKKLRKRGEIS